MAKNFKHTAVPNSAIDDNLKDFSESELKIYLWICRSTIGWGRRWAWLSASLLARNTGLSETSVRAGIKGLLFRRLIGKRQIGNRFEYCVLISAKDALISDNKEDNQESGSNFGGSNFGGSNFDDIKRNMESVNKNFNDTHTARAHDDLADEISSQYIAELQASTPYAAFDVKEEHERLMVRRNGKPATKRDLLNWMKTAKPRTQQKAGKSQERRTKEDYDRIKHRLMGEDKEDNNGRRDTDIEIQAKTL